MIRLRSKDLAWHEVDGGIVCLDLSTSRYLSVNASGSALWSLLIDGANHGQLVGILQSTFDLDEAKAAADVDAFLSALRQRNLLNES